MPKHLPAKESDFAKLDAPGLYTDKATLCLALQVRANKAKSGFSRSWIYRYGFAGEAHAMGLGSWPAIGRKEARALASEAYALRQRGVDPLAARNEKREAAVAAQAKRPSFKQVAEAFFRKASNEWKTQAQRDAFVYMMKTFAYPKIGQKDIAAVNQEDVLNILRPIWETKPAQANLLRIRLGSILDFATVSGQFQGNNPARLVQKLLPSHSKIAKTQSHAALHYRELPAFMDELCAIDTVDARALEFLILTAARGSEVLGARWDEIQDGTWIVPGERMKAGKRHVVPLPHRAVELLNGLPREASNSFLFIGPRKGKAMDRKTLANLAQRLRSGVTVHGFRSSFKDWASEQTRFPNAIVEMSLAHAVGNAVERAYLRSDLLAQRRELMAAWADFCASAPTSSVVPFQNVAKTQ